MKVYIGCTDNWGCCDPQGVFKSLEEARERRPDIDWILVFDLESSERVEHWYLDHKTKEWVCLT